MGNRRLNLRNCPIIEQTGDGVSCGRCCFYLPDGKTCLRHGDVSVYVTRYETEGHLTLQNVMRRDRGQALLGKHGLKGPGLLDSESTRKG